MRRACCAMLSKVCSAVLVQTKGSSDNDHPCGPNQRRTACRFEVSRPGDRFHSATVGTAWSRLAWQTPLVARNRKEFGARPQTSFRVGSPPAADLARNGRSLRGGGVLAAVSTE